MKDTFDAEAARFDHVLARTIPRFQRRGEGKANATINNELALLRRTLNLGARATPPKVTRTIHIPKLKVNNVRKGFFEREEYVKLRNALPDDLRGVLTFGYFTGCRRGEILKLQWSQVDLLERIIRLEPGTTKNDEGRTIPLLADELYQTIAMQKAIRDEKYPECPWVFFRDGVACVLDHGLSLASGSGQAIMSMMSCRPTIPTRRPSRTTRTCRVSCMIIIAATSARGISSVAVNGSRSITSDTGKSETVSTSFWKGSNSLER